MHPRTSLPVERLDLPLPSGGTARRTLEVPSRRAILRELELPGTVRWGAIPEPPPFLPLSAPLAELLEGGILRGRVWEIVGPGRTSFLYAVLAEVTGRGEFAALLDFPHAFDPPSAVRAGIELATLLWVRPPSWREGLRCAEQILSTRGFALVTLDVEGAPPGRLQMPSLWARLARAALRSATALAVLTPRRSVGSFAALVVEMERTATVWCTHGPGLFGGFDARGRLVRSKLGPPGRWRDFAFRWVDAEVGRASHAGCLSLRSRPASGRRAAG
ncbi:MAG: hypothetical protein KatS3mg076_1945 [Candidatus Binatia bacterium]|nr:MAG: hypothetical protein KatS3mg076_1945 [Candidatus Binatia bacterium]